MNAITRATTGVAVVLVPQTFDQLVIFAEMAAGSDLMPKDYKGKPANIMIAVQMGSELGLSPMQSVTSIAVINGRPGVWGDGLIGICRQSPLCQDIVETMEGEGDTLTAVCVATRRGATPTVARFSVADARRAGLWGSAVWAKYPNRMLQNRARGFALRDAFPDLLRGLKTVEELRDTPADTFRGPTLDADPAPAKAHNDTVAQAGGAAAPATPATGRTVVRRTTRDLLDETRADLAGCATVQDVVDIADRPGVRWMLSDGAPVVQQEASAMLAEAYARVQAMADEAAVDFPGDVTEAFTPPVTNGAA